MMLMSPPNSLLDLHENPADSLSVRARKAILKKIADGVWGTGDRISPERELAAELGIHRNTLRRAIVELEKEEILSRVPGSGTYVNRVPAAMHTPVDNLIPWISGGIDASNALALQGVLAEAHVAGLDIHPKCTHREVEREREILEELIARRKRYYGAIMCLDGAERDIPLLNRLSATGLPFVMIDRKIPGFDCSYVGLDERGAAVKMCDYLKEKQKRDVLVITFGYKLSTVEERKCFYNQLLPQFGVPLTGNRILHLEQGFKVHKEQVVPYLRETLSKMLPDGKLPDSVLFINRYHQDISVSAYDVMDVMNRYFRLGDKGCEIVSYKCLRCSHPFTPGVYVRVPFADMGVEAIRMLRRMREENVRPSVLVPGVLVKPEDALPDEI